MIRKIILSTLSLWCCAVAASAAPAWRPATAQDVRGDKEDFALRKVSADYNLSVSADFDGDGKPDRAYLAVNASAKKMGLFIGLSSKGGAPELTETLPLAELARSYLDIVHPGKITVFCDGEPDCKPILKLKHEAIEFGTFEASSLVYYFDGKKFRTVSTGD